MDRRSFFKAALAAAGFGLIGRRTASTRPLRLLDCPIAGFRYHDGPMLEKRLRPRTPLRIVREPENPHDRRAIALYTEDGAKLGYIPKWLNPVPADMLDRGEHLTARIEAVRPEKPVWKRVKVGVYVGRG
jgi:hypothetical protein